MLPPGDSLQRNAALISRDIQAVGNPPLDVVDQDIRMILIGLGPSSVHADDLGRKHMARRVGNLYYDREYPQLLFREMLLCRGRLGESLTRMQHHFAFAGNGLGN